MDMKYCKKCVQPDTRPGLKFDNNGVCFACKFEEEKGNIKWSKRKIELKKIVAWAKKYSKNRHNCIIGVSGGKDSTFQALYAKNNLGLNCLLVNLAPDGITPYGAQNIENLIQKGFDSLIYRPNPIIWKKVIKHAFFKYGNPVKPIEYPLWAVSYITALKFDIPLIIQGENPGITLGVVKGVGNDGNALNINKCNTLCGGSASDWFVDGLTLKDLIWYQFPKKNMYKNSRLKAIYLNYYVKEWGFWKNTEFAISQGLSKREEHNPCLTGRINPYCSVDLDIQIVN